MKYRLTPINIVCAFLLVVAIYVAIRSGSNGWGVIGAIYMIPMILLGILLDIILQKILTKYRNILITETIFFLILFFWYSWTQRTKTYLIPDDFPASYIVTIYEVDSAPRLPDGWNYDIRIPPNGILLTSSAIEDDLPETEMSTYTGHELNSSKSKKGWVRITKDILNCNEKKYHYQVWMVDSNCCMYSTREMDSIKLSLKHTFCNSKSSQNKK